MSEFSAVINSISLCLVSGEDILISLGFKTGFAFIKAGVLAIVILWFVSVAIHQFHDHRYQSYKSRLKSLQQRFPRHNWRPRI